jgi:hypothetical protein
MPLQLEQRVSQCTNALFRRHGVAGPIVTEIHDYVRAPISVALWQGHNFTNVTEALAPNPFVSVATPPMLCVPDVIFLFCHVAEQEVTLVHVA